MPGEAELIKAAGGDFALTLLGFLIIFIVGICGFMVYQMPKNWEKSTDRIVSKICEVVTEQRALHQQNIDLMQQQASMLSCLLKHDDQAKEIKETGADTNIGVKEISTTLKNRPCINDRGRHD